MARSAGQCRADVNLSPTDLIGPLAFAPRAIEIALRDLVFSNLNCPKVDRKDEKNGPPEPMLGSAPSRDEPS